jgi:hypothetical protein
MQKTAGSVGENERIINNNIHFIIYLIFPLKNLYSQARNFLHSNMDKPLSKGNKNNAKFDADQRADDKKTSQYG